MNKLIFIFLISISSCNERKKTNETIIKEETQSEFNLTISDFVILTYQSEWYYIFKNVKPTELTQSELIEIENILKIVVKENNEIQKTKLIQHNKTYPEYQRTKTGFELKLDGFKRQYVPVINDKGQKEVWINFFCDDFGIEYWKTDLVQVDDGGNCFFNLKINLETKEYYELSINGYA
ncbi:hypothetical protein [Maribacter dokdonensis]|uniref:hypothetical protein n=1 Tax=Maribacter dokdonensis TaxID=320912 RepID=UPI0007199500|nr:hypothetical protein [Maribacter dokdonensis]KSA14159.1 putative lipoprotein [Maribacter dokdonensis DSW-8]